MQTTNDVVRNISSLGLVANALARQLNITVSFNKKGIVGCSSSKDGELHISLPYTDDPELTEMLLGYLLHEAGHAKFTDFALIKETGNSYIDQLENICEDIWLELRMERTYAGAKQYLDAVRNHVFNEEPTVNIQSTADLVFLFIETCLLVGRKTHNKINLNINEFILKFKNEFSSSIFDELENLLSEIPTSLTTKRNIEIAKKLYLLMVKAINNNQSQNAGKKSDGSDAKASDGSDAKASDDSDAKASDGSDAKASDGSDAKASDGSDEFLQKLSDSEILMCAGEVISRLTPDISASLTQMNSDHNVEKALSDYNSNKGFVPMSITSESINSNHNISHLTTHRVRECLLKGSKLKRSLTKYIEDINSSKNTLTDSGNKIQNNKLAGIKTGNYNVFRKKSVRISPNCACSILLDSSGSMSREIETDCNQYISLMDLALNSMISVCEGLNVNGVTTACYSFPYFPNTNSNEYSVFAMKDRNESLLQSIFANKFNLRAAGSTPLAEALLPVLSELSLTSNKKKILFVITDGTPDSIINTKHIYNSAPTMNIEIITFLINPLNSLKQAWSLITKNLIVIDDFDTLENSIILHSNNFI